MTPQTMAAPRDSAPVLSQRLAALQRAQDVRLPRSRVKRDLRAGRISLRDALDHEAMQSMTVHALLCAQHRWGAARADKVMGRLAIATTVTVRGLSEARRDALAAAVD